jgi:hypothetical protein
MSNYHQGERKIEKTPIRICIILIFFDTRQVRSWYLFLMESNNFLLKVNYRIIDFHIKKSNVEYFFHPYVDKNKYFIAKRMNPNIKQIENVDTKSIYEGR